MQIPNASDTSRAVALVGCAKAKLARPAAARELYASPLFRLVRDHVERTYRCWHILSARHGLVDPDAQLAPYDVTLAQLTAVERAAWAQRVASRLIATHGAAARFDLYAGARYRHLLVPRLHRAGIEVLAPLAGLRIGEQLAWLQQAALDRTVRA
jgi:hypothetical protein